VPLFLYIFVFLCVFVWTDSNSDFSQKPVKTEPPLAHISVGSDFTLGEEENLASRRIGGNRLTGNN